MYGVDLNRENLREFLCKILLIVLHSLCQLNFACWDILGKISSGYFQHSLISGGIFHQRGHLQSDQETN